MKLVIIGAGGFGRETADVVAAMNQRAAVFDLIGFVDDGDPAHAWSDGRRPLPRWRTHQLEALSGTQFLVGVADPEIRSKLVAQAEAAGLTPATAIHPTATFGHAVDVGPGCIICSHVSITTNVTLGAHSHVNLNATIGHDAVLEEYVTVNPGVNVSGNVRLGAHASIGTGASIIQGISVGRGATVGAGAVVVKDVEPGDTVAGVPARSLRR